jgi:hypothetical protein
VHTFRPDPKKTRKSTPRQHPTARNVAQVRSQVLGAEARQCGVRVVLIEPTGVRNSGFVEAQLTATPSDADGDPYGEFKPRYSETTHAMAKMRLLAFDTVARAV